MKKTSIITAILFFIGIFGSSVNAQETTDPNNSDIKSQKPDYDRNIVVKKKPQPIVPHSCSQTSGITQVRATFDKSGSITEVELIASSGCDGFDQNAVKAAKKIKFKPATKDGEPITVKKTIEYAFSLYTRGI